MNLAWVALAFAACGPIAPREIGTKKPDAAKDAVLVALTYPDAARIVTSERGVGHGVHLVFVTEDGRRAGDLTAAPEDVAIDMTPAWSPDGRFVVFASSRGRSDPSRTSLWVVSTAEGTAPTPLLPAGPGDVDLAPAWSPDGTRIVFASTRGGTLDLWLAEVAVEKDTLRLVKHAPLRRAPGDEYLPAWSPSGKEIAFTEVDDAGARLALIAPDGSGLRRLTDGPGDGGPAFSADGKQVYFSRPAPGRSDLDLWRIPAAGGTATHFLDEPLGDETGPQVSRDGSAIFATSTLREESGRAAWATLVVAPTEGAKAWQALQDDFPTSRLGVTLAPVGLDRARLGKAPLYADALEATRKP